MKPVKYPIPQHHLTTAIDGLRELALRLETEAGALARLRTSRAALRAEELLEQAGAARRASDYFLGL